MRNEVKPAKMTRASRVAADLRGAILRGDLKPGAKVNLDQLREEFGVSLSPLREAISRLVNLGLVEFEDQRGYRIAPVSPENLVEVVTLRAELEGLAIGLAVDRAGLDWESGVLAALHRLNRAGGDPVDPARIEAWETAHAAFHRALIDGCGMPMLIEFCGTLRDLNDRYRRLLTSGRPADGTSAEEHAAIADAAAVRRDADVARTLLRHHIERTGRTLIERMHDTEGA